jgi:Cu-Zn family superoxide dismutase
MPSLISDSYGNANTSFVLKGVTIGGGGADLVGHGLIVHRDPDDFKTQPTGNSGPRLACAVIVKAQ